MSVKNGSSNAQLEVDKLKELVKKLERQNEHLRNKTGKLSPNPKSGGDGILFTKPSLSTPGNSWPRSVSKVFLEKDLHSDEDDDIIDKINSIANNTDASTWLYTSPKKHSNNNSDEKSPEKWMTSELENPSTPELKAAKEEILSQLNPPYARAIFSNYTTPIKVLSNEEDLIYKDLIVNKKIKETENKIKTSLNFEVNVPNPIETLEQPPQSPSPIDYNEIDEVDSFQTPTQSPVLNSGSPHHAHHMPLPSHTRTTKHGLSPSRPTSTGRYRSPSPSLRNQTSGRRSASFERNEPSRRSESPKVNSRPMSPAVMDRSKMRQSLPATPRGRTASPRPSTNFGLAKDVTNKSNLMRFRQGSPSASEIKSKLGAPRQLRQPSKLAAPSAGGNYDLKTPNNNSGSRSQTPRRTLPRPSQTSTKNQFLHKKAKDPDSPRFAYNQKIGSGGTNSPRGSENGSDIAWSEGEFF